MSSGSSSSLRSGSPARGRGARPGRNARGRGVVLRVLRGHAGVVDVAVEGAAQSSPPQSWSCEHVPARGPPSGGAAERAARRRIARGAFLTTPKRAIRAVSTTRVCGHSRRNSALPSPASGASPRHRQKPPSRRAHAATRRWGSSGSARRGGGGGRSSPTFGAAFGGLTLITGVFTGVSRSLVVRQKRSQGTSARRARAQCPCATCRGKLAIGGSRSGARRSAPVRVPVRRQTGCSDATTASGWGT